MVSLILAVYNGEEYLFKQLKSILNQTYTIEEVIISDDCSTDNSSLIIKDFIKEHHLKNWIYIQNKTNKGFQRNFIDALTICHGDYIFFSDQDDIWLDTKVEETLECFKLYPDAWEVCVGYRLIDENDNLIKSKKNCKNTKQFTAVSFEKFLSNFAYPGMSMALRKDKLSIYQNIFKMDLIAHDWGISIANSALGHMYYYDKALVYYRMHKHNTIGIARNDKTLLFRITQIDKFIKHYRQAQIILQNINVYESNNKEKYLLKRIELYQKRKKILESKNVIKGLGLFYYLSYYPSLKVFLADIYYMLKKDNL